MICSNNCPMGAYSREALIKKNSYCKMGACLRWALIWERTQNPAYTVYIIYRKKSAHKSNSELPFPAVKLGFHLSLLTITERYSYSAQSTMKSHFSVKSSVMNNVMDNVKLLKWMLKFQFFQKKKYIYIYKWNLHINLLLLYIVLFL